MENVIELKNIYKSYKNFQIEDLSLQVKKGFVTGFIGANGAGKSTVMKVMMNLIRPDSGEVKMFGMDYSKHEKEIKKRIGFVFDDDILYKELTLHDMKKLIAPCYKQWQDSLFREYCDRLELPLNQKMNTFSKGMKMKASLVMALSHQPDLLIMDEPTAGLDPIVRRQFIELLQDVMLDEEKTIFLSTHIISDLAPIADFITFINSGEIVFSKALHEIEEKYAIVRGSLELLDRDTEQYFLSIKRTDVGFEALTSDYQQIKEIFQGKVIVEKANLEEIMYYSKGGQGNVAFD